MRTLLSGYHNPHFLTITEYMEKAIENLGHELLIFDDRQHIVPGRVRQRIKWLHQFDLNHINKKIVSLAAEKKPDIAIVTGGHRITASTVRALKDNGICTVLWTIDPPLKFQPIIDVAPLYDHIFCQGTEAIELLYREGIFGAQWLPMACDPGEHRPVELSVEEKEHYGNDIVFVGSYYPNRAELFEGLVNFDFGIWGPGWEKLEAKSKLRRCIKGSHTPPSEWLKIYSASNIVLVTHYRDPKNRFPVHQASPRVFEALACKAFVISDDQRDVFSLFKDGEHLISFDNPGELIEKIKYYLDHYEERERIALQGREEVLKNHTYEHRIEKLLSVVEKK
ncbi:MAG: glycosyltransferase [Deltaproteobacteria bacterium]|nr:glycosyltransferase [Deltaproteobacteria bacterium]